jgi:hypothetical protein
VKIARATDEPRPGDSIETYGDARRDALLWADDEIERLRTAKSVPWKKATPHQIMGDGDSILVTGMGNGVRWYDVVIVRCDEDFFELVEHDDEPSDLSWSDIDYWCYTKSLGPKEAAEAGGGNVKTALDMIDELRLGVRQRDAKLAEQQAEIERLEEREGGLRDAAMCPPDCDLLTWVRMLGDEWHKQMAAEAGGTLCDLFTRIDAHIAASRHLPHSGQPLTLLLDCKAKIERLTAELDVACGYLTDRAKDYLWGWNALRNVHGYYSVEGVWLGENFRDVIHWKAAGAGRDGS